MLSIEERIWQMHQRHLREWDEGFAERKRKRQWRSDYFKIWWAKRKADQVLVDKNSLPKFTESS